MPKFVRPAPHRRYHAAAAERQVAALWSGWYPALMDTIAFALMASTLTFSGFVVLLGWR